MSPEILDRLAAAMHEYYLHNAAANKWLVKPDVDQPFAMLSAEYRETNRAAARRIPEVLALIGVSILPAKQAQMRALSEAELYDLIQQNMKTLAPAEHEGWMKERAQAGWTFGSPRDNAKKLHPCMIPFEKLAAEDKEKDRNQVRSYPVLLDLAGLAAVRE